jgi:hypothetical protein
MNQIEDSQVLTLVRDAFAKAEVALTSSSVRHFPGETIVVVEVPSASFANALQVASDLDEKIPGGFVTVRKAQEDVSVTFGRAQSLLDPRVNDLIELLNARSRTSEQQPSLRYIRDAAQTLNIAISKRHHLIFGRRGVGKTALMVEAKRLLEEKGACTFWINVQTMRSLSAYEAFLTTAARLCDLPGLTHAGRPKPPLSVERANLIRTRISALLSAAKLEHQKVDLLIPEIQEMFNLLGHETQEDIFLFLDDLHYLSMTEQPKFLDKINSITRDNPMWIKASGIRHQSRWFTDNPPVGLQTGHDAAIINLDITLEQPAKAKEFLSHILSSYADEAKLGSVLGTISREALDRLVLASGGVPRDFLILSATTIQVARQRTNAKSARVQDVNEAAGRIAQIKLQELEDDAASSIGKAGARIETLGRLRAFLLETKQVTYFRIDFRDKEAHAKEYDLMQSLMDLRLIHLINASLSDERQAGHRSEVYMLDLSQFSGMRLQRNLRVLDFTKDNLVLKDTGGAAAPRPGDTPKRLQSILRRGPAFNLSELTRFT